MVATTSHRPPLRLTRRGRVVVLTFFVAMASLASAVLFTTASRADNPPTGPAPTVVVQPHDTLWSIATRTSTRREPYAAVVKIQLESSVEPRPFTAGRKRIACGAGQGKPVRGQGESSVDHPCCASEQVC
jgi:hypothetical protein